MVNHSRICVCIKLAFFFNGIHEYAVLLQAWVSILVLIPFGVYYIINLVSKYIIVAINSDCIVIRCQNAACI